MSIAALEHAAVGAPITRLGVSLFPVYLHQPKVPRISTGRRARIDIAEAPDAHVPTIQVTSRSASPVLLVEGETVVGGLQHRTLNVSVLVPPHATLDVPVSCVERSRWGGGERFGRGGTYVTRRVRRAKHATVAASVEHDAARHTDQGLVWQVVDHELGRLDARNDTASMLAAELRFDDDHRLAAALEELVARRPLPGQCGIVAAHGSRIVAIEVFATADLLRRHWEPLVRAQLLDAPDHHPGRPSASTALWFLRSLAHGDAVAAPGVGIGTELHVRGRHLVGQALVWDDALVHASAFALAA